MLSMIQNICILQTRSGVGPQCEDQSLRVAECILQPEV